ncbi:unnamed protein product [Meloidogyne enterolobii]|uniref:Uncharacterized protein n=1 Tax=Meloidogyne enterolobii TaxID=390850 RepID=A0ACB0YQW9_MELEN
MPKLKVLTRLEEYKPNRIKTILIIDSKDFCPDFQEDQIFLDPISKIITHKIRVGTISTEHRTEVIGEVNKINLDHTHKISNKLKIIMLIEPD